MVDEKQRSEFRKFAAETMIDVSKLLITLASGFLVLTTSFLNYLPKPTPSVTPTAAASHPVNAFWLLVASWFVLIVSIIFGVLGIGSIATTAQEQNCFNIDINRTNSYLQFQQILFILGFIIFVIFALLNA